MQVYLKSERAADALAAAEQSMDIMQVLQGCSPDCSQQRGWFVLHALRGRSCLTGLTC